MSAAHLPLPARVSSLERTAGDRGGMRVLPPLTGGGADTCRYSPTRSRRYGSGSAGFAARSAPADDTSVVPMLRRDSVGSAPAAGAAKAGVSAAAGPPGAAAASALGGGGGGAGGGSGGASGGSDILRRSTASVSGP